MTEQEQRDEAARGFAREHFLRTLNQLNGILHAIMSVASHTSSPHVFVNR